jgi:hypothetical protein
VKFNPLPEPEIISISSYPDGSEKLRTATGASFQWYLEDVAISGANGKNYLASTTGDYNVRVTNQFGCIALSPDYHINGGAARTSFQEAATIRIFPNPSSCVFHIQSETAVDVTVKDLQGRTILNKKQTTGIDLSAQPAGMYFLELYDADGVLLQTEKILKN